MFLVSLVGPDFILGFGFNSTRPTAREEGKLPGAQHFTALESLKRRPILLPLFSLFSANKPATDHSAAPNFY